MERTCRQMPISYLYRPHMVLDTTLEVMFCYCSVDQVHLSLFEVTSKITTHVECTLYLILVPSISLFRTRAAHVILTRYRVIVF